ncbi:methyl-accepting chemotaxis protein [Geothermobacter hydrogeniphilus]|nr:methyl-accepting chemotaxis protein [Geothermobacter hydrogeniphilus]
MKSVSLRFKLIAGGVLIPAVILGGLFVVFYRTEKDRVLNAYIDQSRVLARTVESARQEMEDKWALGLFNAGMVKHYAEAGERDKVLAAVPVVSAWNSAMRKAREGGYTFKVPKFQPRNPKNQPDELEARALKALKQGQKEYVEIDPQNNAVHYFRPVVLTEVCLKCHGDPATAETLWGNKDGLDPTGSKMENWKVGEIHGAFEIIHSLDAADAQLAGILLMGGGIMFAALVAFAVLIGLFSSRAVINPLRSVVAMLEGMQTGQLDRRLNLKRNDEIGRLGKALDTFAASLQDEILTAFDRLASGDFTFKARGLIREPLEKANRSLNLLLGQVQTAGREIATASNDVSRSSQALSDGATESAASLEKINASMQELANQTKQNAENANAANDLSSRARKAAESGAEQMTEMVAAMDEINESGRSISNIIKVIDEIAFQTNLLALNAAVEAARAGTAGKGFAVVAEEVRNLAGRSARAARETAEMIESTVAKTERGTEIADRTSASLEEIVSGISKASDLVAEIAQASSEQAQGISQITSGLNQIDQVTQKNTNSAESSAAAAEELSGQAAQLQEMLASFKLENGLGVES